MLIVKETISMKKEVEHIIGHQKTMGNLHFPHEKNWIISINHEYNTQKPPCH